MESDDDEWMQKNRRNSFTREYPKKIVSKKKPLKKKPQVLDDSIGNMGWYYDNIMTHTPKSKKTKSPKKTKTQNVICRDKKKDTCKLPDCVWREKTKKMREHCRKPRSSSRPTKERKCQGHMQRECESPCIWRQATSKIRAHCRLPRGKKIVVHM